MNDLNFRFPRETLLSTNGRQITGSGADGAFRRADGPTSRDGSRSYGQPFLHEIFNERMHPAMNDAEIFALISMAQEFDQLKVRDDELDELDDYLHVECELPVSGGSENTHGKVNILLQTYISRGQVNSFSLLSDQSFIVQNATRIARALFEIVLRKNLPHLSGRVL